MIAIPTPILVGCAGLLALFAVMLARMLQQASHTYRALGTLESALRSFGLRAGTKRGCGLDPALFQDVRDLCGSLPEPCRTWWLSLEENVVTYASPGGAVGYYLGISPREILPEESVT